MSADAEYDPANDSAANIKDDSYVSSDSNPVPVRNEDSSVPDANEAVAEDGKSRRLSSKVPKLTIPSEGRL